MLRASVFFPSLDVLRLLCTHAWWCGLLWISFASTSQAGWQYQTSLNDGLGSASLATNGLNHVDRSRWDLVAGGEATLLRPYHSNAVGLTTMSSDGASRESLNDRELRFPTGAGYRTWIGAESPYRVGFRAGYWAFDPSDASLQARPDANGFGRVTHPGFGDVDISSGLPSDRLLVSSSLSAQTAYGQGQLTWMQEVWMSSLYLGIEYADLKQAYRARLVNDAVGLVGRIDNQRSFAGVGPTVGLSGQLEVTSRIAFTSHFRTSILMGRSQTTLDAGEDLDLPQPFLTQRNGTQDRVLSRLEGNVGLLVHVYEGRRLSSDFHLNLEAQNWIGAGNSVNQEGNLGLFGIGLGLTNRF